MVGRLQGSRVTVFKNPDRNLKLKFLKAALVFTYHICIFINFVRDFATSLMILPNPNFGNYQ
ncbi:MAG TPA: hypothetical protein DCQ26_03655 [Marinilabiliales bacterium]|nr:MAG: hypothetical protein A2W95_09490 [Bacteroidetes bacterium GWA2_40_14]OFX58216.1 MAG: hypothetical protein A2W84_03985 [Bacteroidetes bacterium GWC2_40_13]OFX71360.1 MAG: hypothetical protein A2W96_14465 [Bacteroidetes bacterium GWD2_40_43]OFX91445.1 MAG: hypothetical protein A2W97_04390 [Bacteroidetes bacterium GWE2_40_63]OFY19514.1 MAG: hypothetical protein A2W88_02270 [Bacteroidetes bacterium GWF2_40_13]OFZ32221.1 MAG: hypothetical protein A2437_19610 [Bacteroidetes bacterium RIFOXYC